MADEPQARIATVLDDPGSRGLARVYAQAYLDSAREAGVDLGEAVADLRQLVSEVLEQRDDVAEFMLYGVAGRDERLALFEKAIIPRVSPSLGNFLRVVASHGRGQLLPAIAREVGVRFDTLSGRRRVQVTTARPVSDDRRESIRQALDQALPFEPILEIDSDETLLGGLVVRIDDKVYDGSLRCRLDQLRRRLTGRTA